MTSSSHWCDLQLRGKQQGDNYHHPVRGHGSQSGKKSKFVKILEGLDHVGSLDTHNSLPRMHFLKFPPVNYHKTPQTSRVPSLFLFLYVTNIKLVLFFQTILILWHPRSKMLKLVFHPSIFFCLSHSGPTIKNCLQL